MWWWIYTRRGRLFSDFLLDVRLSKSYHDDDVLFPVQRQSSPQNCCRWKLKLTQEKPRLNQMSSDDPQVSITTQKVRKHEILTNCLHCWAACYLICDRCNCLVRISSANTHFPLIPNKRCIAGCLTVFPMPCLETEQGPRHHTDSKQQALHKQLHALGLLVNHTLWGLRFAVRLILQHFITCLGGGETMTSEQVQNYSTLLNQHSPSGVTTLEYEI